MHHVTSNQPYDLTTEHGRAQSHAHSAHGAFLVAQIEKCLNEHERASLLEIREEVCKVLSNLDPTNTASDNLLGELRVFESELGSRDRAAFHPLVNAYSEQQQSLTKNLNAMLYLAQQIKSLISTET